MSKQVFRGGYDRAWLAWVLPPVVSLALCATPAAAAPALTGAGPHLFTLTTFASGFDTSCGSLCGAAGVATRPDGQVLVATDNNLIFRFPSDADGQVASPSLIVADYRMPGVEGKTGPMAQLPIPGGFRYFTLGAGAGITEIDRNGQQVGALINFYCPTSIVPFPPEPCLVQPGSPLCAQYAGHLFVSDHCTRTVYDVNPDTGAKAPLVVYGQCLDTNTCAPMTPLIPSALAFSADGATLYAVTHLSGGGNETITGIDMATLTFTALTAAYPNGTGVSVGLGTLAGYLYVTAAEVTAADPILELLELGLPGGPEPGVARIIATGVSGNMAADALTMSASTFPSLLLINGASIDRLDPPGGGWFGPPVSSTRLDLIPDGGGGGSSGGGGGGGGSSGGGGASGGGGGSSGGGGASGGGGGASGGGGSSGGGGASHGGASDGGLAGSAAGVAGSGGPAGAAGRSAQDAGADGGRARAGSKGGCAVSGPFDGRPSVPLLFAIGVLLRRRKSAGRYSRCGRLRSSSRRRAHDLGTD